LYLDDSTSLAAGLDVDQLYLKDSARESFAAAPSVKAAAVNAALANQVGQSAMVFRAVDSSLLDLLAGDQVSRKKQKATVKAADPGPSVSLFSTWLTR
jgi:hypothetical protein